MHLPNVPVMGMELNEQDTDIISQINYSFLWHYIQYNSYILQNIIWAWKKKTKEVIKTMKHIRQEISQYTTHNAYVRSWINKHHYALCPAGVTKTEHDGRRFNKGVNLNALIAGSYFKAHCHNVYNFSIIILYHHLTRWLSWQWRMWLLTFI